MQGIEKSSRKKVKRLASHRFAIIIQISQYDCTIIAFFVQLFVVDHVQNRSSDQRALAIVLVWARYANCCKQGVVYPEDRSQLVKWKMSVQINIFGKLRR